MVFRKPSIYPDQIHRLNTEGKKVASELKILLSSRTSFQKAFFFDLLKHSCLSYYFRKLTNYLKFSP